MPSHLKRYQTEGHDPFITFSCYQRQPFLQNDHSRITFEETWRKFVNGNSSVYLLTSFMPEHVHLLLSEPKLQKLATTLCVLKGETCDAEQTLPLTGAASAVPFLLFDE